MTKRMRYIQLVGDALIPLLGFFWWNWSLYFIVLFYLADMLIAQVITVLKARKIAEFDHRENNYISRFILSLFLLLISAFLMHVAMRFFYPEINFTQEMIAFWEYEDMGIQQGYILLPLLILIAHQRYKLEFLMPARYRSIKQVTLWNHHIRAYLMLIGAIGFAIGTAFLIPTPDSVLLFGIITGTTVYQLVFPD